MNLSRLQQKITISFTKLSTFILTKAIPDHIRVRLVEIVKKQALYMRRIFIALSIVVAIIILCKVGMNHVVQGSVLFDLLVALEIVGNVIQTVLWILLPLPILSEWEERSEKRKRLLELRNKIIYGSNNEKIAAFVELNGNNALLTDIGSFNENTTTGLWVKDLTLVPKGEKQLQLHSLKLGHPKAEDERTTFLNCTFDNIGFYDCDLHYVQFDDCEFSSRVSFEYSTLENGMLSAQNLSGVKFKSTNANQLDFSHSTLCGANFQNANLRGAIFKNATVDSATVFTGAKLQGADFSNVDLRGVDFSGSIMDAATIITLGKWDETTKFPLGFTTPQAT